MIGAPLSYDATDIQVLEGLDAAGKVIYTSPATPDLADDQKQATFDMERKQFNTVASAAMKMLNALAKLPAGAAADGVRAEGWAILLRVLAPVVPHVTHVLWSELDHGPLLDAPLPRPDPAALVRDSLTLAVQVNGKLRAQIEVQTRVCKTAREARADLARLRRAVADVAGGFGLAPIGERNLNFVRRFDHVMIGEHVALAADDHARAEPLDRAPLFAGPVEEIVEERA